MRLMTYNILTGGQSAQDQSRLPEITQIIREIEPDILVLNECNQLERSGAEALYRLEHELGMRAVLAPASSGYHVVLLLRQQCARPGGASGAGTAARFLGTECLSTGLHHAAVVARIAWGERELRVVGTHLDPYHGATRLAEVDLLLQRLGTAEPAFLLGDLNSISPQDGGYVEPALWSEKRRQRHLLAPDFSQLDTRAMSTLERAGLVDVYRHLHPQGLRATAPTSLITEGDRVGLRIDYIWASPGAAARARRCEIVREPLSERASDHYPVYADFEL
jgi:exodeoxyribonuclease III